jgi:hypothetical protein
MTVIEHRANAAIVGARDVLPAPSYLPRRARYEWDSLQLGSRRPTERFEPAANSELPPAIRRWLEHAIPAGTPLFTCVRLTMSGEIKLGTWRRFDAEQLLVPGHGYIWAARTRIAGLAVSGYDRYSHGSGAMDWRALSILPVKRVRGDDVTRSAAGRLVGEVALLPTAFRSMIWSAAPGDEASATAAMATPDRLEQATLAIDPSGSLTGVRMSRWGCPAEMPWGNHEFGVSVEEESRVDGIAMPSKLRAGWWMGTAREAEGEFLRAQVTAAQFASCRRFPASSG